MKNKIKLYLTFWIVLFALINANAQCETIMKFFKDDIYTSKELVTFAEKDPQKAFDSWKILNKEKSTLRTNIDELNLVSKNLEEIKNAGGYLKWKNTFRSVTKLALNTDDLGKMAINYRKNNNLWHNGNIVVFEYLDKNDNLKTLVQSTIENSGSHAERLAIETLKSQNIPLKNIKKIYSELELCELESGGLGEGGCKKMILDKIGPDIEIIYSYSYPGKGSDLSAKTIRQSSIEQRSIDFNKFK